MAAITIDVRTELLWILTLSTILLARYLEAFFPLSYWALYAVPIIFFLVKSWWRGLCYYLTGVCILLIVLTQYISLIKSSDYAHLWLLLLFFPPYFFLRLLPALSITWLLLKKENSEAVCLALDKLKIPPPFILAVLVSYRFIPTFHLEVKKVYGAARLQYPSRLLKRILHTVPLLLHSSMRLVDELSMAAMTKGLTAYRKRTYLQDSQLSILDYVLWFVALLIWLSFAYTIFWLHHVSI